MSFAQNVVDPVVAVRRSSRACSRSQALVAQTRAEILNLRQQMEMSERRLAASRALLARTVVAPHALCGVPPASAPTSGPAAGAAGSPRRFAAIAELAVDVERLMRSGPGGIDRLVASIKAAIAEDSQPCLLVGVLAEGIVKTMAQGMSASERRTVLPALITLLYVRLGLASNPVRPTG